MICKCILQIYLQILLLVEPGVFDTVHFSKLVRGKRLFIRVEIQPPPFAQEAATQHLR